MRCLLEQTVTAQLKAKETGQNSGSTRHLGDQTSKTGTVSICRQVPVPAGKHRE